MRFDDLCNHVRIMLQTLRLDAKEHYPSSKVEYQFIVDQFGFVVHVIDNRFYVPPEPTLDPYEDWRQVYIDREDDLNVKREEVVWELMKSGYMIWLRHENPRAFKNLILNYDYAKKIIDKRLKIWEDKPKYRFLVSHNVDAYSVSVAYIMSVEPGFFDYMPE